MGTKMCLYMRKGEVKIIHFCSSGGT